MKPTAVLLALYSTLAAASPRAHLSKPFPRNPTPYPPASIEQFSNDQSQGSTTNPNIQNYHASETVRMKFPYFSDDPTVRCRLDMALQGANSQGSWAAWLPEGTASVRISAVQNGTRASAPMMHMNMTNAASGSGLDIKFDPESVLCNQLSQIELAAEGMNTLIFGWEQDLSLPEGISMVAGV